MLAGLAGQAVAGNADAASGDATASLLALLQPIGFGTSYLRIEALMKRYPSSGLQISALQLVSNAAIAIAWCGGEAAWATLGGGGGAGLDLSALEQLPVAAGVLYTGLISTALTVLLQTKALGMLPATDSSVIVATEPLWAAGFASLLLGEVLSAEPRHTVHGSSRCVPCKGCTAVIARHCARVWCRSSTARRSSAGC